MGFFIGNYLVKYKVLYLLLCGLLPYSFASDNQAFQNLDNQMSIGYSYSTANAFNPNYSSTAQTTNSSSLNFGLQQLFNNNLWLSLDSSFMYSATQSGNNADYEFYGSVPSIGMPANVSGKMGYSFSSNSLGLQVIPYLTTGMMLNYNGVSLPNEGLVNSYYILYGGGVRLEYIVRPDMSIYIDQMAGFLNDQGGSVVNQSAMEYNTALGVKYNVTNHLQLGLEGDYNNIGMTGQTVGYNPVTRTPSNNNQISYSGMFRVSYLFDDTSNTSLHNYTNQYLAKFDNSYAIGYGLASANNSYSSGSNSTINSSIQFINIDFSHIFDNNVYTSINGQLITKLTQSNTINSTSSYLAPTYFGFPGSATANVGYAVMLQNTNAQVIPYLNAGIVADINSYNALQTTSLSYILSHDYFLQYGAGARLETAMTRDCQLYFDQLFAELDDQSTLGLSGWRSTSSLGTKYRVVDNFEIGVKGFYDIFQPNSSQNYAANQTTYGAIFSIGMNY